MPAAAGAGQDGKPVVYQVFTRLFGNTKETNRPWGTIEENGVGKFDDVSDAALDGIRELGVTHVWYTGVPHHAVIRDYTRYGISNDDPDVVKGRAGSPYAVKDYYSVDPDLAVDPARRVEEFEALVARTHAHGMRVIIDIVPNHVARGYASIARPDGIEDFGANDDTSVAWARDNDFYYVPGEDFAVPEPPDGYAPLGGEPHPLADGRFAESPAKWTGNGARVAQPRFDDWFETVKINFGVRPDGSHAFDALPPAAREWTPAQHAAYWRDRDVPDSWEKFRDIALYWTDKGVDGFRYDMAEKVPVEFWSFLNSAILSRNPDAFLLAEIYDPSIYRDYIELGLTGYLYDKVGFYDTVRAVVRGEADASAIAAALADVRDIDAYMLRFLENHDEQRIAGAPFAGDARRGKPAMVAAALGGRGPTMLYFGQEVGEPGDGDAGFGDPSRTTIFDYWGVPAHQRWMNGGRFDGGRLTPEEKALRGFYAALLTLSASHPALRGDYAETPACGCVAGGDRVFAFARWQDGRRLFVAANFDAAERVDTTLIVPPALIREWRLADGQYALAGLLGAPDSELLVAHGAGRVEISLEALGSAVFSFTAQDQEP